MPWAPASSSKAGSKKNSGGASGARCHMAGASSPHRRLGAIRARRAVNKRTDNRARPNERGGAGGLFAREARGLQGGVGVLEVHIHSGPRGDVVRRADGLTAFFCQPTVPIDWVCINSFQPKSQSWGMKSAMLPLIDTLHSTAIWCENGF
jgi:hypothetical protein